MELEQETENKEDLAEDRAARSKEAWDAFLKNADEHTVSAMPVAIYYVAHVGRVEHSIRDGEHVFHPTCDIESGAAARTEWKDSLRNPYAMRDEFLSCETWQDARKFLMANGQFSTPEPFQFPTWRGWFTWEEFKRWQRFAYLVQEYTPLVAAMRKNDWTGENGEALKALTGEYPTKFFDGTEIPARPQDAEFDRKLCDTDPKLAQEIRDFLKREERERLRLCAWFRRPHAAACSIEWMPKPSEDLRKLEQRHQVGGAMIEFLLPYEQLQPVLLIRPSCALQAIAAAIYADRIKGVAYRSCSRCGLLFPIGSHKNKTYCNKKSCKNTAHSKRVRENLRDAIALIIEGKKGGLTKRKIERNAKTQGVSLTAHAWEKAKQKLKA